MRHGSRSLIVMMVLYLLMAVAGGLLVKQSEGQAAAERTQHEVTVVSPGTPEEIERLLDGPSAEEEAARTEALLEELLKAQEEEAAAQEEEEEEKDPAFLTGEAALEVSGDDSEQLLYFRFRIETNQNQLNVRKEPKPDAEILAMRPAGTTGYVLYRGEEWSEIVTEDSTVNGYCSNEYLFFTEVEETAFPAFIRREVRPSVVSGDEDGTQTGEEN